MGMVAACPCCSKRGNLKDIDVGVAPDDDSDDSDESDLASLARPPGVFIAPRKSENVQRGREGATHTSQRNERTRAVSVIGRNGMAGRERGKRGRGGKGPFGRRVGSSSPAAPNANDGDDGVSLTFFAGSAHAGMPTPLDRPLPSPEGGFCPYGMTTSINDHDKMPSLIDPSLCEKRRPSQRPEQHCLSMERSQSQGAVDGEEVKWIQKMQAKPRRSRPREGEGGEARA